MITERVDFSQGWNTVDSWQINKVTLDVDLAPKTREQMLDELIAAYAKKIYLGPWPMELTVYHDGRWVTMHRHQDGRYEIVSVAE